MSRAPRVTGAELITALERAGFVRSRIRGSHHFLRQRRAIHRRSHPRR
ncbi:MAG: type II toxin-antitoxin system HicA family toxin [Bryobacteraceae bacterium]|nr:type II toxin-antitoxin system HicA family toxin [Bryobacteraceae bacterium]